MGGVCKDPYRHLFSAISVIRQKYLRYLYWIKESKKYLQILSCYSSLEINLRYIDGLGDAVEQGLVKAVGVSNYSGNCLTCLGYFCCKRCVLHMVA